MAFVRKLGVWLIAFVGALAGAYLGRSTTEARPGPPAEVAAPSTLTDAPLSDQRPSSVTLDPEERTALARELANLRGPEHPATLDPRERAALVADVAAAVQARPEGPAPASPPSSVSLAARQDADLLLGRAAAAGKWTDQDARTLRGLWPVLGQSDRTAVLRSLIRAINEGSLTMSEPGMPF